MTKNYKLKQIKIKESTVIFKSWKSLFKLLCPLNCSDLPVNQMNTKGGHVFCKSKFFTEYHKNKDLQLVWH